MKAAPEKIFKAIEDPLLLARWWGPAGFTCTFDVFDFRPGGKWIFKMHGPDGTDYPNESLFEEIVRPEKVTVRHGKNPLFSVTISIEAVAGGSIVKWVQAFDDEVVAASLAQIVEPANEQVLDKLQALVEGT